MFANPDTVSTTYSNSCRIVFRVGIYTTNGPTTGDDLYWNSYHEPPEETVITIEIPRGRRPRLPTRVEEKFRKAEIRLFFQRLHLRRYEIPDHVLQAQPKPHARHVTCIGHPITRACGANRQTIKDKYFRNQPKSSAHCKAFTRRARRIKKQESRKSQNPVAQCFSRNRIKRTRIFRSS